MDTREQVARLFAVARATRALYLNFLGRHDFAAALAPDCFQPLALESDPSKTLFSILVFELAGARPAWAPAWCSRLAPCFIQSNWRFYGTVSGLPEGERPGVLFWRTLTDSRLLALYGRRIVRSLPAHYVGRMKLARQGDQVSASAPPHFEFLGRLAKGAELPAALHGRYADFAAFARGVMEQRLAVTVGQREVVAQDLRLGVESARVLPLEPLWVEVAGVEEFVENPARPEACFLVEDLEVELNSVRVIPRANRT